VTLNGGYNGKNIYTLQQDFSATTPNQKWVSSITYIATDEGWLYLAIIIDLYSRLIVGWAIGH